jgi:hypothetical protein
VLADAQHDPLRWNFARPGLRSFFFKSIRQLALSRRGQLIRGGFDQSSVVEQQAAVIIGTVKN